MYHKPKDALSHIRLDTTFMPEAGSYLDKKNYSNYCVKHHALLINMFNQRQVNKIFSHVPTRTLRQWALDGFYQWSEETKDGRGTGRHYGLVHVYQIGIVEVLARANFHAARIRRIMQQFFVDRIYQNELIVSEKMHGFLILGETLIGKNRGFQAGTCKRDELEKTLELLDGWILHTVIDLSAVKQLIDRSLPAH